MWKPGPAAAQSSRTVVRTPSLIDCATMKSGTYISAAPCFTAGNATLTHAVSQDSSLIALSSSAAPSVFGQAVSFSASVTAAAPGAGVPTGTVQFQINGNNFGGPVPVSGGTATSNTTTTLSASAYTINAIYSGDTNFNDSTSQTAVVFVGNPDFQLAVNPGNLTVSAGAPGARSQVASGHDAVRAGRPTIRSSRWANQS